MSNPSLPPGLAGRLNPACDRFEAALLAGAAPRMEEFLPQVDEEDQPALLRELLELERVYRAAAAPNTPPDNSQGRLPDTPVNNSMPLTSA